MGLLSTQVNPHRVLVVDDERPIREMLSTVLRRAGYDVEVAPTGLTALQIMRARRFDVVITDIIMPDKEGLETIRDVRRQYPDVKIVAMSGAGEGQMYLKLARTLGANGTLAKPFTIPAVLETVERVLRPEAPAAAGETD